MRIAEWVHRLYSSTELAKKSPHGLMTTPTEELIFRAVDAELDCRIEQVDKKIAELKLKLAEMQLNADRHQE